MSIIFNKAGKEKIKKINESSQAYCLLSPFPMTSPAILCLCWRQLGTTCFPPLTLRSSYFLWHVLVLPQLFILPYTHWQPDILRPCGTMLSVNTVSTSDDPIFFPVTTFAFPLATLWMSILFSPFQPKMAPSLHYNLSFRLFCFVFLLFYFIYFFVATCHSLQDLSFLTRDWNPATESPES